MQLPSSEMLLLGAGASVDAGIPASHKMTQMILNRLATRSRQVHDIVAFAIGGLMFQQGIEGKNPFDGVDVEAVFNAVSLLAERNTIEASPFIGAWHARVEDLDAIQPTRAGRDAFIRDLEQYISEKTQGGIRFSNNLGHSLGEAFDSILPQPGRGAMFGQAAETMISMLKDIVWKSDPSATDYLAPIIGSLSKNPRLVIASLNYDNCIEMAAAQQGHKCNTGINQWAATGDFSLPGAGIHLLKLHGSVDWMLQDGRLDPPRMPSKVIRVLSADEMAKWPTISSVRPAVLFGQRNKLTAEGPFLDLLRAFKTELFNHRILTVIGYSFRDDHINTFISQWMNRNSNRQVRIIKRSKFTSDDEYGALLLRTFPNRVTPIYKPAKDGIRELFT